MITEPTTEPTADIRAPIANIEFACRDCDGGTRPDGLVTWRCTDADCGWSGTDPFVALVCPHCGVYDDIAERNVAVSFDAIERVTMRNGTVVFEVESPGSGDWEGDGWVCRSCTKDVTLPGDGWCVDFVYT